MDWTAFIKITSLALADSVNPCELAILVMVLVTIMTHNPEKRSKVLYGGIAFVSAVYLAYLFYGIVLIQLFKSLTVWMRTYSHLVYNSLAILAMIIGALNIKDYFMYKPGSIATEMPLFMRPMAKKSINGITSAKGAFFIGFIVTLFLLPCTMGPYIVASGLLAEKGTLGSLPWLLYYNLIFVFPMILVVGLVTYGFAKIDDVAGWKERNIRRLHLTAGILLFLTGLAILLKLI
ncbi:hypothetical protein COU57_06860 [Candidatus Pacearchaeota archaeon CG10_big_fil_rev_8_21_14_0_10_32_14]|nr:MAG: hypothetical protein COU57_06860 [Candidatus Pacearchaeota archaeon CG10_big_fil_rev_8_21_14_0_10_32_14]